MRMRDVTPLIKRAVLAEREACARELDGIASVTFHETTRMIATSLADIIRNRPTPSFKVVRPETVEKNPELAKDPSVIVAGVGLSQNGVKIIGKWPSAMRHQEEGEQRRAQAYGGGAPACP